MADVIDVSPLAGRHVQSVEPIADGDVLPVAGGVSVAVTTDSVVATVLVTPNGSMRRISVSWGDGKTNTLTSTPGVPPPPALNEANDPLPAGTYRFIHVYDAPDDRMPFETYALVRVQDWAGGDDISIHQVRITPRYRITHYRTTVWLPGPCDFGGSTNEFDIIQVVDGIKAQQWHWEPSNNFFGEWQSYRLEGSAARQELTVEDGSFYISLVFTETDPWWNPDDVLEFVTPMHATDDSERIQQGIVQRGGGSCVVMARYDREVVLVTPLPDNGPGPVFA